MYYKQAIQISPLQAYASALIFSPANTIIRHYFKKEEPKWITIKPTIGDKWSACLQTLEGHSNSVNSVAFSHDSTRLASASDDRTVKIWDATSGECLQTLEGHRGPVRSVAFSHDSTRLASASYDRTIRIWGASSGESLHTLEGHSDPVNSVAFSHDSARLASASGDKTVKIWDASNGECLQTLEGHSGSVNSVTFSHDSTRLASSYGSTIKIWDSSNSECLQTLEGHSGSVRSVAFSHDSTRLASVSGDKTVKVWDASSGRCLQTLKGHSNSVNSVAFSHDSVRLASVSGDCTVKIWDASSGECLQTLKSHGSYVHSVAFSHDSTRLASASHDRTVKIWDASSGDYLQTLEGHSSYVSSVAFSYDSTRLASASVDRTVKIWDASSGECLQTLEGHSGSVRSVAFSHDSARLASASDDHTLRIWDTSSSKCLQTLNIGKAFSNISFDPTDLYLHSDIGTIAVDAPLASNITPDRIECQNPRYQDVGLSLNGAWITYNSENLVWLPSEYRPSCSAVSGRTIGIGVGSGKVWLCNLKIDGFEESWSQISSADYVPSLTSGPTAATVDQNLDDNEEICSKEDTTIPDTESTVSVLVGVSQDDKNRIITNFSNAIATIFDGYFFRLSGHDSAKNPGKTLFETKLKQYAKAVTADTPQSNEFRRRRNAAKAIFWHRGAIVNELFKSMSERPHQQENESRIGNWNDEKTSEFKMDRIRDWQSEFPAQFDANDRDHTANNYDPAHPNPTDELEDMETFEVMKMESEENTSVPPVPQDYETIRSYLTDHEEFTNLGNGLKGITKHYYRDVMKELEMMLLDRNIVPSAFTLEVEYQIRWNIRQFIQEQYGSGLSDISHILTITGNCHDAQMTTIGIYLSQTWPKYPDTLIDKLQTCLLEPSHTKETYEGAFTTT